MSNVFAPKIISGLEIIASFNLNAVVDKHIVKKLIAVLVLERQSGMGPLV